MKHLTLHELGEERRVLDEFLVETEGEETPEIAGLMDALTGNQIVKVQNCGLYLDELYTTVEVIKKEQARLLERRKAMEARAARFEAYLLGEMVAQGIPLVRTPLITVALQFNNPKVIGEPTDDIAGWVQSASHCGFVRHIPAVFEVDRRAILDAAKADPTFVPPAGLSIVREQGVRLR